MAQTPSCPKCRAPLRVAALNTGTAELCRGCERPLEVELFPAYFRPPPKGTFGEKVMVENEATCFYHAQNKATVVCASCGRFICSLCDVELDGNHLCPTCLEAGHKKGKIKKLQNRRMLYDNVALALAIWPLIVFWLTIFTAPMALYVAIKYYKSPGSILPRTKARYIIAIIIASLEIVGWAVGIGYFATR